MTQIPSWAAVAVSGLLVLVAVAIASWQRLGISREIVVAAVRALVQLVAIGAVLAWLFAHAGVAGALAWVLAMTLVAANESRRRGAGIPHAYRAALIGIVVATASTLGVLVLGGVIDTRPQVLVPIGGMVVMAAPTSSGRARSGRSSRSPGGRASRARVRDHAGRPVRARDRPPAGS